MKDSIKTKLDDAAYKRDGFKCTECGENTGIEAHHVIPDIEEKALIKEGLSELIMVVVI